MKKHIKFLSACILTLISGFGFANVEINSVEMGKFKGDHQSSEFSTIIQLSTDQEYQIWQFGFYMPRSFNALASRDFNPALSMEICNPQNQCSPLQYVKASAITDKDASAGYTTILAPTRAYPLQANQTYTLSLRHNNQWTPKRYSDFPQNFFFSANGQVQNIITTPQTYHLVGYDADKVKAAIQQHINAIWKDSIVSKPIVPVIPEPVAVQMGVGSFVSPGDFARVSSGIIIQKLNHPELIHNNPEGYILQITPKAIKISALNSTGTFYAMQTLKQLWSQNLVIPAMTIIDYPRFSYRGINLDVARHYFTPAQIEQLIDVMAASKLNTLHLHLSDDEAFRLALPEYPSLAAIAASRALGEPIGPMAFLQGNLDMTNTEGLIYPYANTVYQGSYTAADLKAIVAYANARAITVIPEIDAPGHARALIKALPADFVDPNDQSEYISVQGFDDDVIPVCTYGTSISVGLGFTVTLNQILKEMANIFNQQTTLYAEQNEVSLGGDEVSPKAWSNDTSCQGIWSDFSALQKSHYFFKEVAQQNPNLKISGYQQLVENDNGSLDPNSVKPASIGHVWIWAPNGIQNAVTFAKAGYPTVLSFADQVYFDLTYTPSITESGFGWATAYSDTHAALTSAVSASQVLAALSPEAAAQVVGIEAALWSENLPTSQHLFYMALPKIAGLAEAAWSPAAATVSGNKVNWQSLASRLGCGQNGYLTYLNHEFKVNYRGYPHGIQAEVPQGSICP